MVYDKRKIDFREKNARDIPFPPPECFFEAACLENEITPEWGVKQKRKARAGGVKMGVSEMKEGSVSTNRQGFSFDAVTRFELGLDAPGLSRDEELLVGLSGGVDSVVLLHALVADGWHCRTVHVQHGLRGAAAEEDADFCRRLALRLGCVHHTVRVDVKRLAHGSKCSEETAGRLARREVFGRIGGRHGSHALVLGHHADDQAETVLWNLARGCGTRGAGGMADAARQEFPGGVQLLVVRPLLPFRRAEIDAWARAAGLEWREDATNASADYTRNRIRHEVLPVLAKAIGRDPVESLARFSRIVRDEEVWMAGLAEDLLQQASGDDGSLRVQVLRSFPPAACRRVVQAWLRRAGASSVGWREVQEVLEVLKANDRPHCVNLAAGWQVRRRAGRLWMIPG